MFLTAFAVKLLSLRSDIRFRASCTDADDSSETDIIRALCLDTTQAKSASRATDPRSAVLPIEPHIDRMEDVLRTFS